MNQKVARTLVLVGPIGKGKSATGNSILGGRAFKSGKSASGITATCELQQTVLTDGRVLNVIDTPGVNVSAGSGFPSNEFVKCMNMAKDGIHAFLLVFTLLARFTEEQATVIRSLQNTYGNKIVDHMIVVFTGGDQLEEEGRTLDDYLGANCPQPLGDILRQCKNRRVLFDNRTKDEKQKAKQVQQLLSLVDRLIEQNGGQPYTNELIVTLQNEKRFKETATELEQKLVEEKAARVKVEGTVEAIEKKSNYEIQGLRQVFEKNKEETKKLLAADYQELKEHIYLANEEKQKQITDMVEAKFKATTRGFEQQLAKERDARVKVEEAIESTQKKTNDEISSLKESVEKTKQEVKEHQKVSYQELKEQMHRAYEEQHKKTDMIEAEIKATARGLEQQLAEERASRVKVEATIESIRQKTDDDIRLLKDQVEKNKQKSKEQIKVQYAEFKERMHSAQEEQRKQTDMVELMLKEMTSQLEKQLAEEQAARVKAEESAQIAQMKSNDEIDKLRINLEQAQKEIEELPIKLREKSCPIL